MITKENCPNCGSAITSEKCPYCGTLFYDFAAMDMKNPFYIKIRDGNKILRCKVRLTSLIKEVHSEDLTFYSDNKDYFTARTNPMTIRLDMQVVSDDGILAVILDLDKMETPINEWPVNKEIRDESSTL